MELAQIAQWVAAGVAVVSALGGIITALSTRRKASADAVAAATCLFDKLCEKQQARIEQLTKRIEENETEIAELRQELEESRGRERALQERVTRLESENASLKAELEERKRTVGRR